MLQEIRSLLINKQFLSQPAFSGLIHITEYKDLTCLMDSVVNQNPCVDKGVS